MSKYCRDEVNHGETCDCKDPTTSYVEKNRELIELCGKLTSERDALKAEVDRLKDLIDLDSKRFIEDADKANKEVDRWRGIAKELKEALDSMWCQFAYESKDGKGCTGGLSALEDCESALSLYDEAVKK